MCVPEPKHQRPFEAESQNERCLQFFSEAIIYVIKYLELPTEGGGSLCGRVQKGMFDNVVFVNLGDNYHIDLRFTLLVYLLWI